MPAPGPSSEPSVRPGGDPRQGPPPALRAQAELLGRWLWDAALPLWWSEGADRQYGGFHDRIDQQGHAIRADKRARVQARQVYVYATAGSLGWNGPWKAAAWHGWRFIDSRLRRPDGLFRNLVSDEGAPVDETARLYEQSFVLLAMARLSAADPDAHALEGEAAALRTALDAFRHPQGGFRENSDRPFQANAHMHLLEATLDWMAVSDDPAWGELGREIVDLALARFIAPERGCLLEFFDAEWRPAPGDLGRLVEPGHQFEWSWLLSRWARRVGDLAALDAARRLLDAGLIGVDPDRGVAIDELWGDLSVRQPSARLWPQTEWLKAALWRGEQEGRWDSAEAACATLLRYLDTPVRGLWWDNNQPDGSMRHEAAPASSFYHVLAACSELFRVCGGQPA